MSEDEGFARVDWRQRLTPEQYRVTREHGTEPPFSGEYNDFKGDGQFDCVCCGQPLFDSAQKYDSGAGWPSPWHPVSESAIVTRADSSPGMRRAEVSCRRRGAHPGHVLPDGPPPTGQRYSINSLAPVLRPRHD